MTLGGHPLPIIPSELGSGEITKADRLAVQGLYDNPEMILIIWPLKPTVVQPAKVQVRLPPSAGST